MLIINKTNLNNEEIGRIIDYIISKGKEDTYYYGKYESFTVVSAKNEKFYKVDIKYLKRYTKFIITEENNG